MMVYAYVCVCLPVNSSCSDVFLSCQTGMIASKWITRCSRADNTQSMSYQILYKYYAFQSWFLCMISLGVKVNHAVLVGLTILFICCTFCQWNSCKQLFGKNVQWLTFIVAAFVTGWNNYINYLKKTYLC